MNPVLSLHELRVVLGDSVVIDGVSLDLHAREVLLLLGRSGSGKSVLIKSTVGFIPLVSGVVSLDGKPMDPAREARVLRKCVVLVHQDPALLDEETAVDNIALPLQWRGASRNQALDRASQELRRVGASDVANVPTESLSAGVRKLVALARALAHDPSVLLLDEPTTGLDIVSALRVGRTCDSIARDGTALLVVTHDVEPFRHAATQVAVLAGGRLVSHQDASEAWERPAAALQQFLTASPEGPLSTSPSPEA